MIASAPRSLGIDLGSSSFKAVVLDAEGSVLARSRTPTPFRLVASGAEMDPAALVGAIRELVATLPLEPSGIGAIGITSMAESGLGLDARDRPVTTVPAWFDTRGDALATKVGAAVPRAAWARTGRPPRAKSSAALAAALAQGAPEMVGWVGVAEFLALALTGRRWSVGSFAARTGAWDLREQRYVDVLLDAYDLPRDLFPQVLDPGSSGGRAETPFAADLGLPSSTPVVVAGHDHPVGALAVGAAPGVIVDSIGTAEQLLTMVDALPNLDRLLSNGLEAAPGPTGGWAVTGSRRRPGSVLERLARSLGLERGRLEQGEQPVERALSPAERQAVRGVVRDPERALVPEELTLVPHAVWECALRELAADAQQLIDGIAAAVAPVSQVILTGGGTRSSLLVHEKRQLSPVPMVVADLEDASAHGAARIAGASLGWWAA